MKFSYAPVRCSLVKLILSGPLIIAFMNASLKRGVKWVMNCLVNNVFIFPRKSVRWKSYLTVIGESLISPLKSLRIFLKPPFAPKSFIKSGIYFNLAKED